MASTANAVGFPSCQDVPEESRRYYHPRHKVDPTRCRAEILARHIVERVSADNEHAIQREKRYTAGKIFLREPRTPHMTGKEAPQQDEEGHCSCSVEPQAPRL